MFSEIGIVMGIFLWLHYDLLLCFNLLASKQDQLARDNCKNAAVFNIFRTTKTCHKFNCYSFVNVCEPLGITILTKIKGSTVTKIRIATYEKSLFRLIKAHYTSVRIMP